MQRNGCLIFLEATAGSPIGCARPIALAGSPIAVAGIYTIRNEITLWLDLNETRARIPLGIRLHSL